MPKYDAFGREIGEDTLSDWRGGDDAPAESAADVAARAAAAGPPFIPQSPPPVAPAPSEPSFTAAPPPAPPPAMTTMRSGGGNPGYSVPSLPRRRRRTRPRVVAWLIVVAAFVLGGNFIGSLDSPDSIVRRIVPEVTAIPFPGTEGVDGPDKEAAPPVGLGQNSMIRPGPLRKALADLSSKKLGRPYSLRLAPERIDAQMLKSGRLHSVQLTFDGGFREFSVTGAGFGHLDAYALSSLDPTAPQRLVRAAAKRIGKPVNRINYLVASADGWNAYFKGGQYFQGDERGRIVRRIS